MNILGQNGISLSGGDEIQYASIFNADPRILEAYGNPDDEGKKAIDAKIVLHEILHSLGGSHDLMGADGKDVKVDVRTIQTILQYGSNIGKKNSLKINNVKKEWLLDTKKVEKNWSYTSISLRKGERPHNPKSKITSSESDSSVNLKGSVRKKQTE